MIDDDDSHVFYGLDQLTYRDMPGLANSDMKMLRKSPYHYHRNKSPDAPPRGRPGANLFTGTLAHCALLEPAAFDIRYVVGPDISKNSNAWKAFVADCQRTGCEPISQDQHDLAHAHAAALRAVPDVARLLGSGHAEVSAWWKCPRSGVLCKCRPDWVGIVGHGTSCVLLDVKTTEAAGAVPFIKTAATFEYHCQADHYCEGYGIASGIEVLGMVFAVVERDYPYATALYMLDDESLAMARRANDAARSTYAQCLASDAWPGYPEGVQVIRLPWWADRTPVTTTDEGRPE